ncbi:uncharacterized protein BDZ99DRAFT_558523 [Mytilinidion resinicola]|uniref:WW domain-containing protein n=1 Tax=Mytilinidion resinicola TaxID=574789 RepID=A0A6A6YWW7_9PEZI|nr:uncharacterized protein BDZ99DRAFT_558523 [Mytilinidion resinicola]KAF2812494.1 hypothetical protein BDZ99DRAFT_558523 [Mytilinidion resinicola]
MSDYQYLPLRRDQEEIRLISLLPGTFIDDIRISIHHALLIPPTGVQDPEDNTCDIGSIPSYPWSTERTSEDELFYLNNHTYETSWVHPLRNAPANLQPAQSRPTSFEPYYEALSYNWGTMDDPEIAHVQDYQSNEEIEVTVIRIGKSLAMAFRHLRHVDKVRTIWADAISINQQDVEERNAQVKRMADIYRLAYRVVAWTGKEDGDSKHALATLRYIGNQLIVTKAGRLFSSPGSKAPDLWRNACHFLYDDRTWKALSHFIERIWFYRLWCWQEIKLSSSHSLLQCGHDQITWPILRKAILCLHNKEKLPSLMFRERCRHIAYLTADAIGHPMGTLLDLGRSKGCADPRDKIYGLLGLTAPSFNARLRTDYASPVEDVYKDAFLAHLALTRRLELLKHCVLSRRSIGGPSWVPDWSKTDFAAPILSEQLSTGLSSANFKYIPPDILEVTGLRCTAVQEVSSAASLEIGKVLLAVSEWLEHLPKTDVYVTGENIMEAFALTIFMNRTRERHPAQHFPSVFELVSLLHDISALRPDSHNDSIYSIREVGNCVQKIRGRVFFTTVDGYIGTAPDGVKAGDEVCLLLGSYSPIIIRAAGFGRFQVVGEAYIHGLEDAKGILGPMPVGWKVIVTGDALGRPLHRYMSFRTYQQTAEDPRLDTLPSEWERVAYERSPNDAAYFEMFKNNITGGICNSDPRLSPESLKSRNIPLYAIQLV